MISISEILSYLEENKIVYAYSGRSNLQIATFSPLKELTDNSITWIRNGTNVNIKSLQYTNNLAVVTNNYCPLPECVNVICVDDPSVVFFKILNNFFYHDKTFGKNIKSSSIVDGTIMGENITIGHNCYIDKDCILGDFVKIGNNVVIEGNVKIGSFTNIESCTSIGVCGFSHYLDKKTHKRVPHFGGVSIGNNVNIGANCTVCRGTLSDTIIKNNVKIDNLCHIAHNVIIDNGVIIAAGSIIGGSVTIKENAWLSSCTVKNCLTVGANSFIGIGSIVTKDVPAGKAMFGFPARAIKDSYLKKW